MNSAFASAQRLLARREHGAKELRDKLLQKGHRASEVDQVINECQRLGLQSDLRFAESVCQSRIQQGYGPLRIRQELQVKRIDSELIEQVLQKEEGNWCAYALAVWKKKFKHQESGHWALQKQQRFMYYRGFSPDTIAQIVREL
ncbi:recombination regulator RecX [Legionella londiniensis]|uniref:Regulatory protein RecX n=1 Tax=Legionella londiniensis TaxID=45068 RepID=A0A0W0VNE4_9GAMM|nr:recombination regulator RecX [Legionella londiniensis]KTD21691.1 recombination regulator RecX [Legionella londiniensis]STX93474.1 regulatory protein RecX [Legionella londiniensis]